MEEKYIHITISEENLDIDSNMMLSDMAMARVLIDIADNICGMKGTDSAWMDAIKESQDV